MNKPPHERNVARPDFEKSPGPNGCGYSDSCLRALEIQVARVDERVSGIYGNMVKKNDIAQMKVWIVGSVLSATGVGAVVAATVVKAFF